MGAYVSAELPKVPWSVLHSEVRKLGEGFEIEFSIHKSTHTESSVEAQTVFDRCKKYPGHKTSVSVKDFKLEDIPEEWRDPVMYLVIQHQSQKVVKLTVGYVSKNRPDKHPTQPGKYTASDFKGYFVTQTGSGNASFKEEDVIKTTSQKCPIKSCQASPRPHDVTPYFVVQTARHVVFDDSEAEHTTVEFFYDCDKSNVVQAQVVKVLLSNTEDDSCRLRCVSHDLNLFEKVKAHPVLPLHYRFLPPPSCTKPRKPLVVTISHPHGMPKRISFGEWVDCKVHRHSDGTVKLSDYLMEVEGHSPNWRVEGLTQCNVYMSPEQLLEWERAVRENPDVTLQQWRSNRGLSLGDTICSTKYTAATCPGSSGCCVLVYGDKDDRNWERITAGPHFRHAKGKVNSSGVMSLRPQDRESVKKLFPNQPW